MASKKKPTGPKPVGATVHQDKRTNIPTADAQEFLDPSAEQPSKLLYPRDPSLDPQLVWRGKDDTDADDLEVTAPPIFIQEKIDPRVLVENLRKTAKAGEQEPEMTLFDGFDGLDDLDIVDFYEHDANWSNRMILGDSLQVMASLAERESMRGKVQMVYVDPPYGIRFGSNWQQSARKRDVKDGKLDDASIEVEQIKAFRDTWELGIHSYLGYLRDRLVVARDLLTDTGSCFVQIGDENVHLVRSLMDEVFGPENFVSQVAFQTTTGAGSFAVGTNVLSSVADYIIWYGRDANAVKYRQLFRMKTPDAARNSGYTRADFPSGERRTVDASEVSSLPTGTRIFAADNFVSQTTRTGQTTVFPIQLDGKSYSPRKGGWKTNRSGVDNLLKADRLHALGSTLRYIRYLDDFPAYPFSNIWDDTTTAGFASDKVYVVQTNTKVIERCMLMCTDPGDLVLDPTCGSGTAAYVAEQNGRRWITVDTSRVALALARQRLMGSKFPYFILADSPEGQEREAKATGTPKSIEPTGGDIRRGFVYERVQHITLKSIANNPDIVEGMTRNEIEKAIKRHADFELLYDKPFEDKKKVRVSGPFTVESLSPHRSLAFSGQVPDDVVDQPPRSEQAADVDASAEFESMILENLTKSGIQNGRKAERMEFTTVEPFASPFIQAIGERDDGAGGVERVGISVGPQYGTVDGAFIKHAARAAIRADGIELLCVLAFAFDPNAIRNADDYVSGDDGFEVGGRHKMGRLPVLLVRMNNDLVMGQDLKKTGSGNLFTVFGEPDIDIRTGQGAAGDQVVVELKGVDIYDPKTGEVRSGDTSQIALWMVDTNYNEESFFVRHCYFTGGNDPYKRLKSALKADIDEDAWASLYDTQSRPFAVPDTGKIAVKVINDYGDEVMQVFEVTG